MPMQSAACWSSARATPRWWPTSRTDATRGAVARSRPPPRWQVRWTESGRRTSPRTGQSGRTSLGLRAKAGELAGAGGSQPPRAVGDLEHGPSVVVGALPEVDLGEAWHSLAFTRHPGAPLAHDAVDNVGVDEVPGLQGCL